MDINDQINKVKQKPSKTVKPSKNSGAMSKEEIRKLVRTPHEMERDDNMWK
jgi:hypothetical protein